MSKPETETELYNHELNAVASSFACIIDVELESDTDVNAILGALTWCTVKLIKQTNADDVPNEAIAERVNGIFLHYLNHHDELKE